MQDGYYCDRLVLKGGMSVRNHVPLVDHRFSFDADYDPNSYAGFSFGSVDKIKSHITKYESIKKGFIGIRAFVEKLACARGCSQESEVMHSYYASHLKIQL